MCGKFRRNPIIHKQDDPKWDNFDPNQHKTRTEITLDPTKWKPYKIFPAVLPTGMSPKVAQDQLKSWCAQNLKIRADVLVAGPNQIEVMLFAGDDDDGNALFKTDVAKFQSHWWMKGQIVDSISDLLGQILQVLGFHFDPLLSLLVVRNTWWHIFACQSP